MSPAELVERMLPWLEDAGLLSAAEAPGRRPWLATARAARAASASSGSTRSCRWCASSSRTDVRSTRRRATKVLDEGRARAARSTLLPTHSRRWSPGPPRRSRRRCATVPEIARPEAEGRLPGGAGGGHAAPRSALPLFESLALLGRRRTLRAIARGAAAGSRVSRHDLARRRLDWRSGGVGSISLRAQGASSADVGVSSNGRTAASGAVCEGSTPPTPANVHGPFV